MDMIIISATLNTDLSQKHQACSQRILQFDMTQIKFFGKVPHRTRVWLSQKNDWAILSFVEETWTIWQKSLENVSLTKFDSGHWITIYIDK